LTVRGTMLPVANMSRVQVENHCLSLQSRSFDIRRKNRALKAKVKDMQRMLKIRDERIALLEKHLEGGVYVSPR
jgi:aspartyl/asparaginyl-tRNA synthetase